MTGAPLKLRYSANYSGTGDPRLATWFDADVEFPEVNSNEWQNSSVVVPNKESKIYFAFVYTSTVSAGTRWTLDDWSIKDNLLSIPSTVLSYADVEVGTSSASQSILVKISGYGDITVTASAGFQVSLNNTVFNQSVVIPESEAEAGKDIYVRFTPTTQSTGIARHADIYVYGTVSSEKQPGWVIPVHNRDEQTDGNPEFYLSKSHQRTDSY